MFQPVGLALENVGAPPLCSGMHVPVVGNPTAIALMEI